MVMFLYLPLFLEVGFILALISVSFPLIIFQLQFACVVVYFISVTLISEWRVKLFEHEADTNNAFVQKATDSLMNYETVHYFNALEHESERYIGALKEYEKANIKVSISLVIINNVHTIIITVGLLSSLILSTKMHYDGLLTIGDIVMLITLILQIYAPMFFIGTFYRVLRRSLVGVKQIFDLLNIDQEIKDVDHPLPCDIHAGKIEFKNVSFSYKKNDREILKNANFVAESGKSIAFVGPTGSGKTTIGRLMYRLYDTTKGQILIDGLDISKLKQTELQAKISIVPQDIVLFNDTLMYNLSYAIQDREHKSEAEIQRLVESA